MDAEFEMTQGDAAPAKLFTLNREDGSVADLTTATNVDFLIYRPDTNAQTNTGATSCVIQSPGTLGQAQYNWHTTDLPVSGRYRCLLRITYAGGLPETAIVYIKVESNTV